MKKHFFLLLVFIWTTSCGFDSNLSRGNYVPVEASTSSDGGEGVGGGNSILSTEEEVLQVVHEIDIDRVFELLFQVHRRFPQKIENQAIQRVFRVFFEADASLPESDITYDDSPISKAVSSVKVDLRSNIPCEDSHGAEKDGSHKKGEICLNVLRLAKLPRASLFPQVVSLLVHEFAHEMGFGEGEAKAVQNFVLRNIDILYPSLELRSIRSISSGLEFSYRHLLTTLEYITESNAPEKMPIVCHSLTFQAGRLEAILPILEKMRQNSPNLEKMVHFLPSQDFEFDVLMLFEAFSKLGARCIKENSNDPMAAAKSLFSLMSADVIKVKVNTIRSRVERGIRFHQ